MSPPAWAFLVENFDQPPSDELICPICSNVFCDPVQTPCQHAFCRSCIMQWFDKKFTCPLCCNSVLPTTIREVLPVKKNLILSLKVRCINSNKGCVDIFPLESAESHIKECSWEFVMCGNDPCKDMYMRKYIKNHETNLCNFRKIHCSKCNLLCIPTIHDCIVELKKNIQEKDQTIQNLQKELQDFRQKVDTSPFKYRKVSKPSFSTPSFHQTNNLTVAHDTSQFISIPESHISRHLSRIRNEYQRRRIIRSPTDNFNSSFPRSFNPNQYTSIRQVLSSSLYNSNRINSPNQSFLYPENNSNQASSPNMSNNAYQASNDQNLDLFANGSNQANQPDDDSNESEEAIQQIERELKEIME